MKKPLPVATPDSRPFWNGLSEHKVMVKRCRRCSILFHYPRRICPGCFSSELTWERVTGRGRLYTYTISRRPTHPLFADEVPQYLAIVELDEGIRLTSTLVNVSEDNIKIGMELESVFERHEEQKITMLRFQPADVSLRESAPSQTCAESPRRSLLTDEILSYIGRQGEVVVGYPISLEEIRRFCFATDDLNPRFLDPDAGPDGIDVPPMFLSIPFDTEVPLSNLGEDGAPATDQQGLIYPPLRTKRKLFGGYQVEYFREMHPGDILTRQRKILDIYERHGNSGTSIFVVIECTYTNQKGEKIAVDTNTIINR